MSSLTIQRVAMKRFGRVRLKPLIHPCQLTLCSLYVQGKDYSNPRIADFHTLSKPDEDMYDRGKVPRMPW